MRAHRALGPAQVLLTPREKSLGTCPLSLELDHVWDGQGKAMPHPSEWFQPLPGGTKDRSQTSSRRLLFLLRCFPSYRKYKNLRLPRLGYMFSPWFLAS